MKPATMTLDQLQEAVYNLTGADFDLIEGMTETQLRDILEPSTTAPDGLRSIYAPRKNCMHIRSCS